MEYAPQQPLPGLEEYEVQPALPVDGMETTTLLDELDVLHETINEFEVGGRPVDDWVMELYADLEQHAINEGLMAAA